MKRDEREYEEEIPETTQKARLEKEAASLLSLPTDTRRMVMMKLKPIYMYALYAGVDNEEFKRWCDYQFWDWAFFQMFPGAAVQETMRHPRWKFFAHAIATRMSSQTHNSVGFVNPRRYSDLDNVEIEFTRKNGPLRVTFYRLIEKIGTFLFNLYVQLYRMVPVILRDTRPIRLQIEFVYDYDILAQILYQLFNFGYKFYVDLPWGREFNIGCHICGQAANGYSAEDPSKLLCGPTCNKQ
jgi:hypothetical protein